MKFRFPIIIIDEDFRSENISGSGIRDLAEAIEGEGIEVIGLTSYGDLTSFAQQASRASCFILSIDDEEFLTDSESNELPALNNLRAFIVEVRKRNEDIPIFLYGETRTSRHMPNDILREFVLLALPWTFWRSRFSKKSSWAHVPPIFWWKYVASWRL